MFCSECGTKINEGAKFCFNCGTKIVGTVVDANKISKVEKEILEEFVWYVEAKTIELYVEGRRITPEFFYKKAKRYEVEEEQVDRIVDRCEEKISKLEKFMDGVYEECTLFKLDEDEEKEILSFGNALGFDDEDTKEIKSYYDEIHHTEEKRELYLEYILNYMDDGKTHIKYNDELQEYQIEVCKIFEKNIAQMEKILKEQYEKVDEYELSQEQIDLIYSEGEKLFPERVIGNVIYGYNKKSGVLKFLEEKEKQKALARMIIFKLYGEEIAYTEQEGTGISVGKCYRKMFQ